MRLSFIAAALASAIALCEGSSKMVIGYFPNWLYANYPVETIPFNKYTHINYAFAILNNEDNLPSFTDDYAVESSLPKIIDMAHANNSKVLLSVGGWTGSKRFSPMVATPESRKKFIDWNLDFINKYNTDGVDLDWEYPGKQAAGCNEFAENDADNFLLLLKELRQALDSKYPEEHKEISMAVHVQPFIKAGVPMTDLKEFVPYFDHVNLMTYDMNGAWASTTGPNAPFQVEEGKGAPFSFVTSIRDWKAAGVPANKITAGLAFYGRTMKAKEDMTIQRNQFQSSEVGAPKGDSDDAYWDDPYCNVDTGGFSGIWKWTNLRKEGLLKDDHVTPGDGWQRNWDNVTQTPWLFNPSTKHFITYDDPQSLNIKVEHALCEDLAGVMVWDIHQDNGELVDIVNRIHNPAPASCENVITVKDETVDGDDEEELDDLGNLVVNPTTSVDIEGIIEETGDPEDDDFNEEEWEDENWLYDDEGSVTTMSSSSIIVVSVITESPSSTITSSSISESSESTTTFDSPSSTEIPSEVEDYDGKSCSDNGEQKCASVGKSGTWLTCNFEKWLARDCAPGLVCNENQGAVYCDFPATQEKIQRPDIEAFDDAPLEVVVEEVMDEEMDFATVAEDSASLVMEDNDMQEEGKNPFDFLSISLGFPFPFLPFPSIALPTFTFPSFTFPTPTHSAHPTTSSASSSVSKTGSPSLSSDIGSSTFASSSFSSKVGSSAAALSLTSQVSSSAVPTSISSSFDSAQKKRLSSKSASASSSSLAPESSSSVVHRYNLAVESRSVPF